MEKEEFVRLIVPIRETLMAQARMMTGDADGTEDLVQEVMLRLWNMRQTLHEHPNPGALAQAMLRNLYYDEWRHRQVVSGVMDEAQRAAEVENPVEAHDQVRLLYRIVEHLPPLQRRIFRMKEIEGYGTEEIREATGGTAESIRQNLSRARRKVREDYVRLTARRIAVAVVAGAVAFSVVWLLTRKEECYAYVDGKKITDKTLVESEALEALDRVASTDEETFEAILQ